MTEKKETSLVAEISQEMNKQLADPAVSRALLQTTFKGLKEPTMKQAILEGMMRGFTFDNFLKKDVYALPFGGGYSLITSIDYSRKIAMNTGKFAGKDRPEFEEDEKGKVVSCSITVKKIVEGHICDFTATVYFEEYTKKRDLWVAKPRTMIAKVAEMHALRMAFPEQLTKQYIEEEMEQQTVKMRHEEATDESESLSMGNLLVDKNEKDTAKKPKGKGKTKEKKDEVDETSESDPSPKDIEEAFDRVST